MERRGYHVRTETYVLGSSAILWRLLLWMLQSLSLVHWWGWKQCSSNAAANPEMHPPVLMRFIPQVSSVGLQGAFSWSTNGQG